MRNRECTCPLVIADALPADRIARPLTNNDLAVRIGFKVKEKDRDFLPSLMGMVAIHPVEFSLERDIDKYPVVL